jgi:hypothetical protein
MNKINELYKRIDEFEVASANIIELISELFNDNPEFTESFNNNYNFDESYDNELFKHIMFLQSVKMEYKKKVGLKNE